MNKLIIFTLILLSHLDAFADSEFPLIENHWLRAAPPNSMMMAAYGEINNNTDQDKILIGVYSPHFHMAEIHKTSIIDGIAKMEHQDSITLKNNESLIFKPGGLHIMLMNPVSSISIGDIIKICLIYQQGDDKTVQHIKFPVIKK